MHALAIVIPAYKPDFFRATLASLAAQTDHRFRVYVGDDAGPPEIARACAAHADTLDLVHRRYDTNLGGRSLAAHWNRCVRACEEPWIWLFSDDDVMGPDCVAAFHEELARGPEADVLRFDTDVIDARGARLEASPPHPRREAGVDFVHARLQGRRNSFVVEYVFRREAFERAGGFPELPVAWCADDVAWFRFAGRRGIRTLPRGRVAWRASGINITDANGRHQREKLAAGALFLRFVREEVEPADGDRRSAAEWKAAAEEWYLRQVRHLMPMRPSLLGEVLRTSGESWRAGRLAKIAALSRWNVAASLRALRGRARRALARARARSTAGGFR